MTALLETTERVGKNERTIETEGGNTKLMELIEAVAQGDQNAFTTLYDRTHRLVFGIALRIVNDHGTAEEITMDVYLQVWRQAANFQAVRGTPIAWLITIARSRAIDRLRSTASRRENESLEDLIRWTDNGDSPEQSSMFTEQRQLVRAAVRQLKPEQRVLIETAYFEDMKYTELAERFGLPLGTVKTRIRRGMMVLRKHLSTRADLIPALS